MPEIMDRQTGLSNLSQTDTDNIQSDTHTLNIQERRFVGKINLRFDVNNKVLLNSITAYLGYEVPTTPNRTVQGNSTEVLSLGPDEWLILFKPQSMPNFYSGLLNAIHKYHTALNDVSDARTVIRLSGRNARDILEKGCSLDLHPSQFMQGYCAQTKFARIGILLNQIDNAPTYDLFVSWSYAHYLWSWLQDAGYEYGLKVLPASE